MVAKLALVAVAASSLATAASALADDRPGSVGARIATIPPGSDVQALGVLPDHRIVAAGTLREAAPSRAFVRAYLPGGGLDAGFGNAGEVPFDSHRWVGDVAIQPDGRILLSLGLGTPRLVRLDADGRPDTSFGADGAIDVAPQSAFQFFEGLALQPDGRIVGVGTPAPDAWPEPVLARRFLPDGSPDPSFGDNGQATVATPGPVVYTSVASQPGGGLVLAMQGTELGPWIARISAGGRLDGAFGRGGAARLELGRSRWRGEVRTAYGFSWRPVVLPDGRIRVPVIFGDPEREARMALVGLTADGHVDRRFGRDGLALAPRPAVARRHEWPRVAITDGHGSILVAGGTGIGDTLGGEDSSVVRRFRRDGSLDRSFGRRGLVRDTFGPSSETIEQELAMLDGDTAVLAEEAAVTRYQQWHGGVLHTLNAGYDREDPFITLLVAGCRSARVRVTDLSAVEAVVVRADGRVIRRTTRKRLRFRIPSGTRRVSVRAIDLAQNVSTARLRLARC
jgi:uncharacterized delta-60 repeat protein